MAIMCCCPETLAKGWLRAIPGRGGHCGIYDGETFLLNEIYQRRKHWAVGHLICLRDTQPRKLSESKTSPPLTRPNARTPGLSHESSNSIEDIGFKHNLSFHLSAQYDTQSTWDQSNKTPRSSPIDHHPWLKNIIQHAKLSSQIHWINAYSVYFHAVRVY